MTAGKKLREAITRNHPLMLMGVGLPWQAKVLCDSGYDAAYLSGAGLSNFGYGVPDVGLIELDEVAYHGKALSRASGLPVLVDVDTGWQDPQKTVETLIQNGIAGMHIEDQTEDKRCGHLDGKSVVSVEEMCARLRAAMAGKTSGAVKDEDFVIMARTDAYQSEGLDGVLARFSAFKKEGVDAFFADGVGDLEAYNAMRDVIGRDAILLANITEHGKTPLYNAQELAESSVDIMLMPVSLMRASLGHTKEWAERVLEEGSTQFLVDEGHIRERAYYNSVMDYDPKVDSRDTMIKKLSKGETPQR